MKILKKLLLGLGIAILFTATVYGQDGIKLKINGQEKNYAVAPVIVDGRVMLPLRDICQSLYCEVTWNDERKTAQLTNKITIVAMQVNNKLMSKKDIENQEFVKEVKLDVPPRIINGSTMVPARALAEALNAQVNWEPSSQTVDIIMEYESISDFHDGLAIVYKDKKYGAINENRQLVIPLEYDRISSSIGYQNGVMIAEKNDLEGLINGQNQVVVPFEYEYIYNYQIFDGDNSRLVFKKNGKCGLMDNTGKYLIQPIYDAVDVFYPNPNIVVLELDKKYGFARLSDGKILQEPFCKAYREFNYNEKLVKTTVWNGDKFSFELQRYGLISEEGVKLDCVYEVIIEDIYNKDIIQIQKDGKRGTIDKDGVIILKPIYEELSGYKLNDYLMSYKIDGNYGLITTGGRVITEPLYIFILEKEKGVFSALGLDNKYYTITVN